MSMEVTTEAGGVSALHNAPEDSTSENLSLPTAAPPRHLPEDLLVCLEVIENNLLESHARFSKELKMCWEEQSLVHFIQDILVDYVRYLPPFVRHRSTVSASPTF